MSASVNKPTNQPRELTSFCDHEHHHHHHIHDIRFLIGVIDISTSSTSSIMGLTRTPPHQSTTSLLPRPLPPPYPSGQPPVAVSPEATSSRVTLDAPPRNVPVLASVSISARTDEEGNDAVMEEGDSTLEPQPMDVDVPVPPLQVSSLAVSDPAPVPATPTSRRKPSSSSAEPSQAAPRPKPTTAAAAAATTATTTTTAPSDHDYGKHYDMLLQALEVAVRKGANKWT